MLFLLKDAADFDAFATSKKLAKINVAMSFFSMLEVRLTIEEKKIIYTDTVRDDMPDFLIDSTKLKLCREITIEFIDMQLRFLDAIPITMAEIITAEYSKIPSLILP